MSKQVLVIHGGAGTIRTQDMTAEMESAYLKGLEEALLAGYSLLEKGSSAVDAVLAATKSLEDNILFNAGRGSVFAADGAQEMDASIMDGSTLKAGAVSAVRNIRKLSICWRVGLKQWDKNHVSIPRRRCIVFLVLPMRGWAIYPRQLRPT